MSAATTNAFEKKLASAEWAKQFEVARTYLGLSNATPEDGMEFLYWFTRAMVDTTGLVDGLMGKDLSLPRDEFSDRVWRVGYLVEFVRVAAALASWLGTSSVDTMYLSLLFGVNPRGSALERARHSTASNDFLKSLNALIGFEQRPLDELEDILITSFADTVRQKHNLPWDDARRAWNQFSPGRKFDSTEAFRKVLGRARKKAGRSSSETSG